MHLLSADLHSSTIAVFQEKISTEDNFSIHATCYHPENSVAEVILIGSAIGVQQEYYRAFARFLAARGYIVYTFDYRGIGKSMPADLKNVDIKMQEWGKYDLEAMIKHIRSNYPYAKLSFIGHSISGNLLALAPESRYISKAILVASQHVNWRLWPLQFRFTYAFLVYVLMPLMSHLVGYYPGKALKIFCDLPKAVALEWARWCRSRNGMFAFHSDKQLNQIQAPLLAIGFSDDAIAPFQPMQALLKKYGQAAITHWQFSPRELGIQELGHFAFFRPRFKNLLWEPVLEWLNQSERYDNSLMSSLLSDQIKCMELYN